MSTKSTIAYDAESWNLYEEMCGEQTMLEVRGGEFMAWNGGCRIELPPAVIDAIRAAKPERFPHLRLAVNP